MTNTSNDNRNQNPSRREFLGRASGVTAAIALLGAAAPAFAVTSSERADAWFDRKMAERVFVASENGALVQKGVSGYWSGGPGASAHTIYHTLRGNGGRIDPLGHSPHHPWDADDFRRCVELLDAVPAWRGRMNEMAQVSPEWANLSKHWSAMESAFAAGEKAKVTAIIKHALSSAA